MDSSSSGATVGKTSGPGTGMIAPNIVVLEPIQPPIAVTLVVRSMLNEVPKNWFLEMLEPPRLTSVPAYPVSWMMIGLAHVVAAMSSMATATTPAHAVFFMSAPSILRRTAGCSRAVYWFHIPEKSQVRSLCFQLSPTSAASSSTTIAVLPTVLVE